MNPPAPQPGPRAAWTNGRSLPESNTPAHFGGASDAGGNDRRPAVAHASMLKLHRARRILVPLAAFLLVTLGCSAADLVQRPVTTPAPTRTLAPTFTPTPDSVQAIIIVTPPSGSTPGVITIPPGVDPSIFVVPPPTETPTPDLNATPDPNATLTETPVALFTPVLPPGATVAVAPTPPSTPTQSPTPTATPSPTPTLTPTPFIVLDNGFTALREGPGVEFPLVAQLGPDIPITVVGRNTEGTWLQLCCVNGNAVWVAAESVRVVNDVSTVSLVQGGAPPTPTWTPTATETPTITPTPTSTPYPFERAIGPQFFPTNNEFLTVWVKLFIGTPPLEVPAEGYFVKVLFEGFERPPTNGVAPSQNEFEFSAPPGSGNRVQYNWKYEYTPPDPKTLDPKSTLTRADLIGSGNWTLFVTDGTGKQLSDAVTFTTAPSNPNREVYVGWVRTH